MAKKSVSTSRADRADDKRKRDSNKAENKRNSRKRDAAIAAAGGASALAAKTAASRVKIYRHNLRTSVNQIMQERPYSNRNEVIRDYRKTSAQLARGNKVVTGQNAEPRAFQPKGESMQVKSASRVPKAKGSAPRGRGSTRYGRLTGGGGRPGGVIGSSGRGSGFELLQ